MNFIEWLKNIFITPKKLVSGMSDKNYITTLTGKKIFYNKIYGIEAAELVKEELDKNVNLYNAKSDILDKLDKLPSTINEAYMYASSSEFVKKYIPKRILDTYKNELC